MATSTKNILVTGANGQLGTEIRYLHNLYPHFNIIFTDFHELDITNAKSVEKALDALKPAFLVNCAAYTAVDKAEQEGTQANLLNAIAPKILADACKKYGAKLIHVSTDYVFDGKANTPYNEDSTVNPQSVYGKTKLTGEQNVLESGVGMVIRTSWLYSAYGSNFVKTILKHGAVKPELGVVFDQTGTPTWAHDLAKAILQIIDSGTENFKPEIFHYSNEGVCSWFDFAHEIVSLSNLNSKVKPIETKDYPTLATRPQYSVMNKQKIRNLYNVETPYWRESLIDCLKQLR
ncbi:MAG TPA: dTDP-4-dehydrorhamnose reductase [Tenuifilaceae bacterium]|nr:dTDP-4-dehydrorhamnose reductase [Tenuifilaceae bacterium]HPN21400.1 dTDP-4-dehydrorhamnose reductase [Tenuifilaceae bacterium]